MFAKLTAFFTTIVIFFQMIFGGYPIFGGSTQELNNYEITGSIAEGVQTYTFTQPSKTAFNRFTLSYDSNAYLRGSLSYTYKNKTYTEDFYMEPGQDQTYASFIDAYLDYGCGKKITKLTIESVNGESPVFTLNNLITTVADVYSDFVYIQNNSYKIAASLLWGGALAYLEDFNDNDNELVNLINCHDTGRLVQQSYYGTSHPPYEPGTAFDQIWPYNPVQGGNKFNQNSKIIDIIKTDTSLYIKSRAREWAKPDFTYCYMENTYTLHNTHIQIDNRFVDYSPYTHPVTTQECPAFYTVSALDRYVYYDGSTPWTGDTLTYRDDLGFWGDPAEPQVNKVFTSSGDESWSAFVNSQDWGFGVFSPTVNGVKSGRYEYNGTKDATAGATNYIAPLGRFAILYCEPVSYSYYLATGTTEEMRDLFHSLKDTTQNQLFG